MFSSSFTYTKINHCLKKAGDYSYVENVYRFRGSSGKLYIAVVEQYDYNVYVVKFYLQEMKNRTDRYNILSNLNECSRVLTTIGMLMQEIFGNNPYASFGFIGVPLKNEAVDNTKRFRLYSRIVQNKISATFLEHHPAGKLSAYLLVNRNNSESDLIPKLDKMFNEIYILHGH